MSRLIDRLRPHVLGWLQVRDAETDELRGWVKSSARFIGVACQFTDFERKRFDVSWGIENYPAPGVPDTGPVYYYLRATPAQLEKLEGLNSPWMKPRFIESTNEAESPDRLAHEIVERRESDRQIGAFI